MKCVETSDQTAFSTQIGAPVTRATRFSATGGAPWLLLLVCMFEMLVPGCSRGGGTGGPSTGNLDRWLPDIAPHERRPFYDQLVSHAIAEFSRYAKHSDHAGIAANAVAARAMVEATRRDVWSETPLVLYAFLHIRSDEGSGTNERMMSVGFCDLSRRVRMLVLTFFDPSSGECIEIRIPRRPAKRIKNFSSGVSVSVKMAPLSDVLQMAAETHVNGPAVIQVDDLSPEPFPIPDPDATAMYASIVNDFGRRSNSVRVEKLYVPVRGGVGPQRPFGEPIRSSGRDPSGSHVRR